MGLIRIFGPMLLLSAACVGYGSFSGFLLRYRMTDLPLWLRAVICYFLGQLIVVTIVTFLAIGGEFKLEWIVTLLTPGVLLCLWLVWNYWSGLCAEIRRVAKGWWASTWYWKLIDGSAAALFALGISTIGGVVEGDAIAVYLALPKLTAFTGRLVPLPGYEAFSWLVGPSEMLIAILMALGMPDLSSRIYSWANYLPTLIVLFAVARRCAIPRRGAAIAIVMALTSSAAISLWGSGKTDLFALGPTFCAILLVLKSWSSRQVTKDVLLAGAFAGFGAAIKFSYIPVVLPGLLVLLLWRQLFAMPGLARSRNWLPPAELALRSIAIVSVLCAGMALGLLSLLGKNWILLHEIVGGNPGDYAWFTRPTTTRLLLSYPIALTYGRYWAQMGTVSPLILSFFPLLLWLRGGLKWHSSPLAAVTISATVGLLCWLLLMPSIFMPRYLLATLLLFSIPAAAGAAHALAHRGLLSKAIPLATLSVIVLTPLHVSSRQATFQPTLALHYLFDLREADLFGSNPYFLAQTAVNLRAKPGTRILLTSYYRLWLRGDLLATAPSMEEVTTRFPSADEFWSFVRSKNIRILLYDANNPPNAVDYRAYLATPPAGLEVCKFFEGGQIAAFEVSAHCQAHD